MPSFEKLKPEYTALWEGMSIRPQHKTEVTATARRIVGNRPRYEAVSAATGVPWHVIGIIHAMECGLSFKTALHNGDALADKNGTPLKTVQVPKGRGPFATWDEAAIDALAYDGLTKVKDWSVERIAYELESFNGFGHRRPNINIHSPYLWSFTTCYERGKFIADGKWSAVAVSTQCGAMALLKVLMDTVPDIAPDTQAAPAPNWPVAEVPEAQVSLVKEGAKSKSVWWLFSGVGAWIETQFGVVRDALPDVQRAVGDIADPLTSLGAMLKLNLTRITFAVSITALVIVIYRHSRDKAELAKAKGEQS